MTLSHGKWICHAASCISNVFPMDENNIPVLFSNQNYSAESNSSIASNTTNEKPASSSDYRRKLNAEAAKRFRARKAMRNQELEAAVEKLEIANQNLLSQNIALKKSYQELIRRESELNRINARLKFELSQALTLKSPENKDCAEIILGNSVDV